MLQSGKDAIDFGIGLFNGDSWKKLGNGALGIFQTYRDAIDHDMESFDHDLWAKRIDAIQNATPEQLGYGTGYIAGSILISQGRGIGGSLLVDSKVFGAGSKLFGWGGQFRETIYMKGILNNNNYARLGWQMTSNQTMRFGLRLGQIQNILITHLNLVSD